MLKSVLSFGLGAISVLAFAPFEMWWLPFFTLAALFQLLHTATPKQGAVWCFSFGMGLYLFGVSWVYNSLSVFGGMPFWMGSAAVLGFCAILSLLLAVYGWAALSLRPMGSASRLWVLALIWPVGEWLKSWVLTGFPWLDLGYTQTPSWLFSWAPLGGVYLVSLSVALVSAAIVLLINRQQLSIALAVIVVCTVGAIGSNTIVWTQADNQPLTVGIAQGNIPIETKWQSEHRQAAIQTYRRLTASLSASKPDLVVWPETALPLYRQQTDDLFWRDLNPLDSALLVGLMDSPTLFEGNLDITYNAALLQCDDGTQQIYRKRHLVPFGEYMPLRFVFAWVLDYLNLPMSDQTPWSEVQKLSCKSGLKVGLSICYEDAFADEHRRFANADIGVLVNISEDAWFGDSLAAHQRRQMAQMRARELERPMIRSANSGPSAFIDFRGEVISQTDQFVPAALVAKVLPRSGQTLFHRIGPWSVYAAIVLLGVLAFQTVFRR